MSEIPHPGPAPSGSAPASSTLNGFLSFLGVVGLAALLLALMLPAVERGRWEARRSQCKSNLKQIALALHDYTEEYHTLPPAYTVDADGKPLHSWRTLILPFLDQAPLYNSINLAKAWDDPVNAEAAKTVVAVYHCPSTRVDPTQTTYLANASQSGCFRPGVSRRLSEITDGTSNTIMVIEAPEAKAVPWMSPHDADESLIMSLSSDSKLQHQGGVHAALCDGAVRFLSASTPIATRRALLTIEAGDDVGDF